MDDFDRLLEYQLRRKLDPLVGARVPVRRARSRMGGRGQRRREKETTSSIGGMTDLVGAFELHS
jgi:hypothetical protein